MTSLSVDSSVSNASMTRHVPGHVAHVDVLVDRGRHVGDGEQPALLADLHGDGARADAVEDLLGQAVRDAGGGLPVGAARPASNTSAAV